MKPPFPYFGGKISTAEWLISLMPPHKHYVEPYAGSLAVLLAKPRVDMETVNDLDAKLMGFWRIMRERPLDLEAYCALTPHSRAEHQIAYEPVPEDHPCREMEEARRFWIQLTQGRAGIRRKTGWRHYVDPAGSSSSLPAYLRGYVARIPPAAERLIGVSLESMPALDLIRKYGANEDVLLYVDPPYLGSTRTWGNTYVHELRTPAEHQEVLDALLGCKASILLSGYASEQYDEALAGWERRTKNTGTGQSGEWGSRVEVAWCNRPIADGGLLDLIVQDLPLEAMT